MMVVYQKSDNDFVYSKKKLVVGKIGHSKGFCHIDLITTRLSLHWSLNRQKAIISTFIVFPPMYIYSYNSYLTSMSRMGPGG